MKIYKFNTFYPKKSWRTIIKVKSAQKQSEALMKKLSDSLIAQLEHLQAHWRINHIMSYLVVPSWYHPTYFSLLHTIYTTDSRNYKMKTSAFSFRPMKLLAWKKIVFLGLELNILINMRSLAPLWKTML